MKKTWFERSAHPRNGAWDAMTQKFLSVYEKHGFLVVYEAHFLCKGILPKGVSNMHVIACTTSKECWKNYSRNNLSFNYALSCILRANFISSKPSVPSGIATSSNAPAGSNLEQADTVDIVVSSAEGDIEQLTLEDTPVFDH